MKEEKVKNMILNDLVEHRASGEYRLWKKVARGTITYAQAMVKFAGFYNKAMKEVLNERPELRDCSIAKDFTSKKRNP